MITIRTAAERPDLWKISNDTPAVWPEYNMTAMSSASGEYVFPKGLATVHIDRDRDTGRLSACSPGPSRIPTDWERWGYEGGRRRRGCVRQPARPPLRG
jgi:hypothetical protein